MKNPTNEAFFSRLGGEFPDGDNTVNIAADEALLGKDPFIPIAGLHGRPGENIDIAIEDQFLSDEPDPFGSYNHSQAALIDSLAVYATLSQADPDLNPDTYKTLLHSSAIGTSASLENLIGKFGRLFDPNLDLPEAGNEHRDALYQAIYAIQDHAAYQTAEGKVDVVSLVGMSNDTIVTQAKTNIAYRYALVNLNPFVVVGDESLYAPHNTKGQLDIEHFNDQYLQDRGEFLTTYIARATYDVTGEEDIYSLYDPAGRIYKDLTDGITFGDPDNLALPRYVFGSEEGDSIAGQNGDDHLYGMGGDDEIKGGAGEDYLSGGRGDDFLYGGSGKDTLNGGAGSDYLYGGTQQDFLDGGADDDFLYGEDGNDNLAGRAGNDQLYGGDGVDSLYGGEDDDILWGGDDNDYLDGGEGLDILYGEGGNDILLGDLEEDILDGGEGFDTYIVTGEGGGHATLNDSGANRVIFNGTAITFGYKTGDNTWQTADGQYTISQNSPLTITDSNGNRLTLDDPSGDNFGLRLFDSVYDEVVVDDDGDRVVELDSSLDNRMAHGTAGTDLIYSSFFDSGQDDILYADGDTSLDPAGFLASDTGQVTDQRDWLAAGGGNDVVYGNHGDNVIFGGLQSDLLLGGGGDDQIYGDGHYIPIDANGDPTPDWELRDGVLASVDGSGKGSLGFRSEDDIAAGYNRGSHADTIYAGTGNDTVYAGLGDDTVHGGDGDDYIEGNNGQDSLFGETGNDVIHGDNHDTPLDEHGDDYIDGGAGDDQIQGYGGDDQILGGEDNDLIIADSHSSVREAHGNDTVDGGAGNDEIQGNGGDDTLHGGSGNDVLFGDDTAIDVSFHGNDVLYGEQGDDFLIGGAGQDRLFGGDGNDQLEGDGVTVGAEHHADDLLDGGKGEDVLFGGGGNDTLLGGEDDDILVGDSPDIASDYQGDDYLHGGDGDDLLYGDGGNDVLYGGTGDDMLSGGQGDDHLYGGAGNDLIHLGAGDDVIEGGEGFDTYVYSPGSGNDTIIDEGNNRLVFDFPFNLYQLTLGLGSLKITVGDSGDAIHLSNFDPADVYKTTTISQFEFADGTILSYEELIDLGFDIEGSADDDILYGTSAADRINAYSGDDTIHARAGDDTIDAGQGDDVVYAGAGNDQIDGGAGADILYGGRGDDTYLATEASDTLIEYAGEGTDTVETAIDYTLGDNLENLTLLGPEDLSGTGNALDNTLRGNAANNHLSGLDGDDLLYGNRGDDVLDGGAGNDTLVGGEGNDVYYVDSRQDTIHEASQEGTDQVYSSATFSLSAHIENLTLTGEGDIDGHGNDQSNLIIGNDADNKLQGGAGDDVIRGLAGADWLDGGRGADVMEGGTGDDTYVVDSVADSVVEERDAGVDTVRASVDYTLGHHVEKLSLIGNAALNGTGNDLDNILTGNSADNILDGGAGTDTLAGGAGNDTYIVDNRNDIIEETANAGHDVVEASTGYTLSANLEDLHLTGESAIDGTGNEAANALFGNSADNILFGLGGNDRLYGKAGDDTLDGGAGHDRLYGEAGDDTLYGGDGDDYLHGGAGENVLYGGTGNDTLIAGQTMHGGRGDDTYYVENEADQITEGLSQGHDQVYSSATYTLSEHIEALNLTGFTSIDGTGNDQANILTGNSASNVLRGEGGDDILDGGWGADALYGGTGDDTFIINDSATTAFENAAEGHDLVESSVSYTLGENIEDLELTGSGGISGTGNDRDNTLTGNEAGNVLSGLGGNDSLDGAAGDDLLYGGSGDDYLYGGDDALSHDYYGGSSLLSNNDQLDGGAGDDYLDGGSGNDLLYGGDGNDYLYGGDDGGTYVDDGGYGGYGGYGGGSSFKVLPNNDTLHGGAGTDTLYGGTGNDQLYGGADADTLYGGSGHDLLDGGTGIDVMAGDSGDDIYYVDGYTVVTDPPDDNNGDTDPGSGGEDPADWCEDDYNLFDQIELKHGFKKPRKGNEGVGNGEDPPPPGHDDNWNDGPGTSPGNPGSKYGRHRDTKEDDHHGRRRGGRRGAAPDWYGKHAGQHDNDAAADQDQTGKCDNGNTTEDGDTDSNGGNSSAAPLISYVTDEVIESAGEGYDIVNATIAYTLTPNVEELRLIGPEALTGTGNSLDNRIVGNEYANRLDGAEGADTLIGGLGDDTYVIDDASDTIIEQQNEGIDTVETGLDYQLGNHLENLTLTGQEDRQGRGNALDNRLTGNDGDNHLYGGLGNDILFGGAGNDRLIGGAGDDTYRYAAGGGVDRIEDSEGINTLQFAGGIQADQVVARTTVIEGETRVQLRLLDPYGNELADQGIDFVQEADGSIPIDSINFADGSQSSLADIMISEETYTGSRRSDQIMTDRNDDTIHAGWGNDLVNAAGGNDVIYGEKGRDTLFAGAGDDQVYGGDGDDSLYGSFGLDVLHGGADRDKLYGGAGNDLLFGAEGRDELYGGSGNDLLIGAQGDDVLAVSCGEDLIAYNKGDGLDTISFDEQIESATVSLGGGIVPEDISLSRDGEDLVLLIGEDETGLDKGKHKGKRPHKHPRQGMVFEDWYDDSGQVARPYLTLQIVMAASPDYDPDSPDSLTGHKVQGFDLSGIIEQFDLAQVDHPSSSSWDAMNALLDNHLESSDEAALGGDLAYQYGLGTELFDNNGIKFSTAPLRDPQFGREKQPLET